MLFACLLRSAYRTAHKCEYTYAHVAHSDSWYTAVLYAEKVCMGMQSHLQSFSSDYMLFIFILVPAVAAAAF